VQCVLEDICRRIEEGDVLTGSCPDADVAGRRNTSVLALQQADALVALGDGRDDMSGLIGGAVIDDDDLRLDARLPLDRCESFAMKRVPL
jgi:hypothetical protein